jgi:hypothetical protein
MVLTDAKTYKERGFNITDTWEKRCNKILFFSDTTGGQKNNFNWISIQLCNLTDETMQDVIPLGAGKSNFEKLREAFKFVYIH